MTTYNASFQAQIEDWVRKVKGAEEAIFLESVEELVARLNRTAPVDTGFLRASLVASNTEMPALSRPNPDRKVKYEVNLAQLEAVISGSEIGDTIYLGYTAKYGAYVHFGAGGRQPRPWVQLVAQQWQEIVAGKVAEAKQRFGL